MNGSVSAEQFKERFASIKATVTDASTAIRTAGENTQSFGDRISGLASKFSLLHGCGFTGNHVCD